MTAPAVRLAADVWRIPTAPFDGINSFALLDDDGSVTLVDTGLKRAPARIVAGLASIKRAPSDVTRILLTHAHPDHVAGLGGVRERTGAPVALHPDDVPYAREGRSAPHDPSDRLGRFLMRLPGATFPPFQVEETLADRQVVDVAGGLRVVHTPGHSPGHVSLLHEDSGVLITGDCVWNVFGVRIGHRALCTDIEQNRASAALLADLSFTTAAFTHGPHVSDRARERVAGLTRR